MAANIAQNPLNFAECYYGPWVVLIEVSKAGTLLKA